jgi:rare lipoprotein A (peptidoglycan hydrolase)
MEKDLKRIGRFARDKKIYMATAGITASLMFACGDNSSYSQGHEPYSYAPLPMESFKELKLYEEDLLIDSNTNSSFKNTQTVSSPQPTNESELSKIQKRRHEFEDEASNDWIFDPNVSWYGPGLYNRKTACGQILTKTLLGVANKTLPCGTIVDFKYKGSDGVVREISVPVVDRGPYVVGRQWDLTSGLAVFLHHTFTGPIYYKIKK